MWTKEEIRILITQWETKTREEIAEMLDCSPQQITSMAGRIRTQTGFKLPRKHQVGVLGGLIKEVIDEL